MPTSSERGYIVVSKCCLIRVCRYNRGWFYHREQRYWLMRAANMEPLVKTHAYERGSYTCFDPNTWETIPKVGALWYFPPLYCNINTSTLI